MPVPNSGSTLLTQRGESFSIGRTVGIGGMGTIVQATHIASGRIVALKFLHDTLRNHPTIPQRFLREVELASSLSSAHVAHIFGIDHTIDGSLFMIMELLTGHDLCHVIHTEHPIAVSRIAYLIAQACEALEEAHAHKIIHRDLKPENLFITRARDHSEWVKVLDFGISKITHEESSQVYEERSRPALTRVGTTVGTPEYMAPEQLRGVADLDLRADIYSLGVVLYESLSGQRPYRSQHLHELLQKISSERPTPLEQLRTDIPVHLSHVVMRAMAYDRNQRFANARELRETLLAFTNDRPRAEGTVFMESSPRSKPVSNPFNAMPEKTVAMEGEANHYAEPIVEKTIAMTDASQLHSTTSTYTNKTIAIILVAVVFVVGAVAFTLHLAHVF